MSSDPPRDAPSLPPESPDPPPPAPHPGRAAVVATLGAALVDSLEEHLPGTRAHAESTGAYAFALAVALTHDRETSELIRETARLHDVGMVYVPATILRKPVAELDEAERTLLASHLEAGARLVHGAGMPDEVGTWILQTRERYDGDGPESLAGDEIPLASRIIRVACAVDLMLGPSGFEPTVAALRGAAATELDPRVVDAAAELLMRTVDPG